MIGKLIGHTEAQTAHRHANLAVEPVKLANEKLGTLIQELMKLGRAIP